MKFKQEERSMKIWKTEYDGLEIYIQLSLFCKRDINSLRISPERWLSYQQNGQWKPAALLIHYS